MHRLGVDRRPSPCVSAASEHLNGHPRPKPLPNGESARPWTSCFAAWSTRWAPRPGWCLPAAPRPTPGCSRSGGLVACSRRRLGHEQPARPGVRSAPGADRVRADGGARRWAQRHQPRLGRGGGADHRGRGPARKAIYAGFLEQPALGPEQLCWTADSYARLAALCLDGSHGLAATLTASASIASPAA